MNLQEVEFTISNYFNINNLQEANDEIWLSISAISNYLPEEFVVKYKNKLKYFEFDELERLDNFNKELNIKFKKYFVRRNKATYEEVKVTSKIVKCKCCNRKFKVFGNSNRRFCDFHKLTKNRKSNKLTSAEITT